MKRFVHGLMMGGLCLVATGTWVGTASGQAGIGRQTGFWLSGGAGVIPEGDMGEVSLNAGASYRKGHSVITARRSVSMELPFFIVVDLPVETTQEVGVLYGRVAGGRWWQASASAGVGVVWGMRRGDFIRAESLTDLPLFIVRYYEERPVGVTVGIPLEARLSVKPLPFVGLGVYGFANVNPEVPFVGIGLAVQIGWMR